MYNVNFSFQKIVLLPSSELPLLQVSAARAAERTQRVGRAEGSSTQRLLQYSQGEGTIEMLTKMAFFIENKTKDFFVYLFVF
jgi:hypothetical protein